VRAQPAAVGQADGAGAHGEFTWLDRAESLRLLASAPVGRLIFTVNALPAVRLMNFAVVGGLIVLRTAAGTTVARKVDDAIVAFEADDLNAATALMLTISSIDWDIKHDARRGGLPGR
jgi:Pyridoxamine 5'-phosphate oxidase